VEHRNPGVRGLFEMIEHRRRGTATMDRKHAPADRTASLKDATEDEHLIVPVAFEFRTAIKADLADVSNLWQESLKQLDLGFSFVDKLRMQTDRGPDPRETARQTRRAAPGARRCRDRENIEPASLTLPNHIMRIGVEIQVAMEVDHFTPCNR
jgi:hypothetical protein